MQPDTRPSFRQLSCARCGTPFACNPGGECWCSAEPYRLPVLDAGTEDCLCLACLRAAAARRDAGQNGSR